MKKEKHISMTAPDREQENPVSEQDTKLEDTLVDEAWRILCNVSEGDWTKQQPEWQEAVTRFRDKYHADLDVRLA